MTTKSDADFEAGSIGVDEERIVEELIFSQAEGLADGIRELGQNGADAPGSSEVDIQIDPDEQETIVKDDGDGMDLSDDEIREFLSDLGKSTKRDDDTAIGQFGIGFGQALAKGKVTVHSGDTRAVFNAKEWFRQFRLYEAESEYDGFHVKIEHYDDEVPDAGDSKWDSIISDVKDRFQYMELVHDVEVTVNGERVSDHEPEQDARGTDYTTYEDDKVKIVAKPRSNDTFKVYSAGLFVTRKPGTGLGGRIVTKENLDVNTARNSIKSGCDLWSYVESQLDQLRYDTLSSKSASNYSAAERAGAARLIRDGHADEFEGDAILKNCDGELMSVNEIESAGALSIESDGAFAQQAASHGLPVLSKGDSAVQELRNAHNDDESDFEFPELTDLDGLVEQFGNPVDRDDDRHIVIDDRDEWNSSMMSIAQAMAREMGIRRDIVYGEDPAAHAWTDGTSFIAITESACESGTWAAWVPEVFWILCHEAAHNDDNRGDRSHGNSFNRSFRKLMEDKKSVMVEFQEMINSDGLNATKQRYSYAIDDELL
jgi:hypothetical protein